MWSAGVVLFSMLYGSVPFKGQDMTALHWSIIKGEYELKEDVSQEARDLIRGLLNIKPKDWLTPEQVLSHLWMDDTPDSIDIFSEQEMKRIRVEYTFNNADRYNRNTVDELGQ